MNLLLLSGGIESTCLAFRLKPNLCLTIDNGQRQAKGEIRASRNISEHLSIPLEILEIDVGELGSGQMAGKPAVSAATIPELWPYRNQLLVTLAAMKYAGTSLRSIIIGSTKTDSNHADGRAEFVDLLCQTLAMQEGGVGVIAPGIHLESIDLLRDSKINPDILDMTFSCFQSEYPCGRCRGCLKNEVLRSAYYAEFPTCQLL